MSIRDIREAGPVEEHFPPEVRTPEGRALYRLVSRLGTSLAKYAASTERKFEDLKLGIRLEIDSLKTPSSPTLPPMRSESSSSVSLLEQAKREVEEKLSERARQTPGPLVEATPDEIARMVESSIAGALQRRDNAANDRFVRWQRGALAAVALAFLTALAGAAGVATWSKAQGHVEGFREGAQSHPAPPTLPAR